MRKFCGSLSKFFPYAITFAAGFLLAMAFLASDKDNSRRSSLRRRIQEDTRFSEEIRDMELKKRAKEMFQPRGPDWKPDVGDKKNVPSLEKGSVDDITTTTTTKPPIALQTTQSPAADTSNIDFGPPAPVCNQKLGKFGIFMIYTNPDAYIHATNLMKCYAHSRGYEVIIVQPFTDELSKKHCDKYKGVFFRKHCVASVYLQRFDWMLVTDADTAIINADHCIEDFVEPKAEVIHYERYFTSEIAAGNYIVRNTTRAVKYLQDWADYEFVELPPPIFSGADNGFIHLLLLKVVYPENTALYDRCKEKHKLGIWPDYEPGYGQFIGCCKEALRTFNPKIHKPLVNVMIYARGQAWVRDTVFQDQKWWSGDFMAHGIKTEGPFLKSQLDSISTFAKGQIPEQCNAPNWRPLFTEEKHKKAVSQADMKAMICGGAVGMQAGKLKPVYGTQDMSSCWPTCPWVLPLAEGA